MTLRQTLLLLIVAATATVADAQPFQPGSVYFGQNNYIEYRAGNLPLIITAPHGGTLLPTELNDRTCGTNVTDTRTQELIRELEYEIHRQTGRYPHIIICRISRRKIDVNRDSGEATCNSEAALPYWIEWHKYIDSAKAAVVKQWGKGLYLDLHGHGHTIQRLEWGYLVSAGELGFTDAFLNQSTYIDKSSIRSLANTSVSGSTYAALLRGPASLGTMLANVGIPGVPSTQEPNVGLGSNPYYMGGYNSQRHGSRSGGTIDGVQLECHSSVRINHLTRFRFAALLANGLLEFMKVHYFPLLESYYCYDVFGSGIPLNTFDEPYSQDFDDIFPGDQTGYYADNAPGFPGNYTLMTLGGGQPQEFRRYTVGASTSQNGYIYNTGHIDSPSDRAVGLLYSSTTGPVAFGLRFVNNTGADINSLTIQYAGEQWFVGGTDETPGLVDANTLEFEYMVAEYATNLRTGDYVSVPALNFVSPNTHPAYMQTAVDGNASANRRVLTATVNVTIPQGGEIMLRWIDRTDDPGFDHLLAIDDVVVTPRSGHTSVDVEGMSHRQLVLYPNPTSGSVTVEVPGSGEVELQIRSITSKLVLMRTIEAGKVVIDVGTLGPGIYLISAMKGVRELASSKFIILNN